MKAYRRHHPRDASHPDGKPEPRRHCKAERRQGRAASRAAGDDEAREAYAEFEEDLRSGGLTDPRSPEAVVFEPEHDGETWQW